MNDSDDSASASLGDDPDLDLDLEIELDENLEFIDDTTSGLASEASEGQEDGSPSGIAIEEAAPGGLPRVQVRIPTIRHGPWRETVNQDYWLLTQSQENWLHPFEILGHPPSWAEFREALSACSDFLSKESARGKPTPDRILRSARYQACQDLPEQDFSREVEISRWHSRDWFDLQGFIAGACADVVLSVGEKRLVLARARSHGFTDEEVLSWIRTRYPGIHEETSSRGDVLLRGVFADDIDDCDMFVDYVTRSPQRWAEAIEKRRHIEVVAPNLAGDQGRRLDEAVLSAERALTSFKGLIGLKDDPSHDSDLWLLALLWKAGTWKSPRPALRVPTPVQGDWVQEPTELVAITDAHPEILIAAIDGYYLPFWLLQYKGTRDLVRRITRAPIRAEASAWQVLWEYGETRIRVAGAVVGSDEDLLSFLSRDPSREELFEFDRLLENQILDQWAIRTGKSAIRAAFARGKTIQDPELRRRTIAWSLGEKALVPGVDDIDGFAELARTDMPAAAALIRDGTLGAWLAALGRPIRVDAPLAWDDSPLVHAWLLALDAPDLLVGRARFRSITDLVAALFTGGAPATWLLDVLATRLAEGTLEPWLGEPISEEGSIQCEICRPYPVFPTRGTPQDFEALGHSRVIRDDLLSIIRQEAPITFREALTRVCALWGGVRATAKVQRRIDALLASSEPGSRPFVSDGALWLPGQDPSVWRVYRVPSEGGYRRTFAELPLDELANAAESCLAGSRSMPRVELRRQVVRLFGATVTVKTQARIDEAVAILVRRGRAGQNPSQVWLPPRRPKAVGPREVLIRLWRHGLRAFHDPRCGWLPDPDAFVGLCLSSPSSALACIRDGSIAQWLNAIGAPCYQGPMDGISDSRLLHGWVFALGRPILMVGGRSFEKVSDLVAAMGARDERATRLMLDLVPLLEDGTLDAMLPLKAQVPETGLDGVRRRLWQIGFRFFYDPATGWIETPRDFAIWGDRSDRNLAFAALIQGPGLAWIGSVDPVLAASLTTALASNRSPEACLRIFGLPEPTFLVSASEIDLGVVPGGTTASLPLEVTHTGPRGALHVQATCADKRVELLIDDRSTPATILNVGQVFRMRVTARAPHTPKIASDDSSVIALWVDDQELRIPVRFESEPRRKGPKEYGLMIGAGILVLLVLSMICLGLFGGSHPTTSQPTGSTGPK